MDDSTKGCDTNELQDAIANAFPTYSYNGPVMNHPYDPSDFEDEADNLDVLLHGRNWRQLKPVTFGRNDDDSVSINERGSLLISGDEYVLMDDRAIPAFLAPWLWKAVENLN